LDPALVGEVLDVLRALKAEGMTMVLATHEMAFAREAADKVCFLDEGRILEEGPPSAIFAAPREDRTRGFLARVLCRRPAWRSACGCAGRVPRFAGKSRGR